jgi:hypothetical protein
VSAATAPNLPPVNTATSPISVAPTTTAVNYARLPAAVRDGAPGARQAYATAQSFEEMLLGQLSQSLMQSSGLSGEGEGESSGKEGAGPSGASSDGAGGMLASLLPQTLTEGVMHAGGLGLAAQLLDTLDPGARDVGAQTGGTSTTGTSTTSTVPTHEAGSPIAPTTGGVSA